MVLLLKYIVSELINTSKIIFYYKECTGDQRKMGYGNIAGRIRCTLYCTVIRHLDLEKY